MTDVGKAKDKIPKLTRVAERGLVFIRAAKHKGQELSLDEALDRACDEAGDTTLAELKGAVRIIVLARLRANAPSSFGAELLKWLGHALNTEGADMSVVKTWFALAAEMGDAHAASKFEELQKLGGLKIKLSRGVNITVNPVSITQLLIPTPAPSTPRPKFLHASNPQKSHLSNCQS